MKIIRTETIAEEIETKPCPFCGGQPKFSYRCGDYGYTPSVAMLWCSCGAEIKISSEDETEQKLAYRIAKAWNRRVE